MFFKLKSKFRRC